MNHLVALLEYFHKREWDYDGIANNPCIPLGTLDLLQIDPTKYRYNTHPQLSLNFIRNNPQCRYSGITLSYHKNIKWQDICAGFPPGIYRNTDMLCLNKNVTWEIMHAHPAIFNNYRQMSKNPNIRWRHIEMSRDKNWDFYTLTQYDYMDIPWSFIAENHLRISFCWNGLSKRKDLSISVIKDHPNLPWIWMVISEEAPFVTINIVKENPQLPWDYMCLSSNKRISWTDIKENSTLKWDIFRLLSRKDIPWEFVHDQNKKKYKWVLPMKSDLPASLNLPPNSLPITEVYFDDKINWYRSHLICSIDLSKISDLRIFKEYMFDLSCNKTLTSKMIIDHPQLNWHWHALSQNTFDYEKKRKRKAAIIIQRTYARYRHRCNLHFVCEELRLLPPKYISRFEGGSDYKKAKEMFLSRV